MIYLKKQEGLYQNKVTYSLVSTCSCKWAFKYQKEGLIFFIGLVLVVPTISLHLIV